MLKGFSILLGCLLAGQALSLGLGLPVPGAIVGMLLLLLALALFGLPPELERTSTRLLAFMPVFILPASAGVVDYGHLFKTEWLALGLALTVSLCVSFVITPRIFQWCMKLAGDRHP